MRTDRGPDMFVGGLRARKLDWRSHLPLRGAVWFGHFDNHVTRFGLWMVEGLGCREHGFHTYVIVGKDGVPFG